MKYSSKISVSSVLAIYILAVLLAGCGNRQQAADIQPQPETSAVSGTASGTDTDGSATIPTVEEKGSTAVASSEEGGIPEDSKAASSSAKADTDIYVADEPVLYKKTDAQWDCPKTGFVLTLNDRIRNLNGQIIPEDNGILDFDSGLVCGQLLYVPRTDSETEKAETLYKSYNDENDPDGSKRADVQNDYHGHGMVGLLVVLGVRDNISLEEAMEKSGMSRDAFGRTGELGQAGSYKFYYLVLDYSQYADQYRQMMTDEFYSEFESLAADADNIASAISVKEPQNQPE